MAVVFTPIFYQIGIAAGVDVLVLFTCLNIALNIAFATPAASAPAALGYVNDWILTKHSYKFFGITVILGIILMLFLGIPVAKLLVG